MEVFNLKVSKNVLGFIIFVMLVSLSLIVYVCNKSSETGIKPTVSTLNKSKQSHQLTQKEKLADFQYMYNVLKENYPFFEVNKRVNNVDWLSKKSKYIKEIKETDNDNDFYITLKYIVKELNNWHTEMLDGEGYNCFKAMYSQTSPWSNQLNKEKTKKRYNFDENATNSIENTTDVVDDKNLRTELMGNRTAYISISSFGTQHMKQDSEKIRSFLTKVKDYNALIIDIRGNGGGNVRYWLEDVVPLIINNTFSCTQYQVYRGGNFSKQFIKFELGDVYSELEPIKNLNNSKLKNMPKEIYKNFKYFLQVDRSIKPNNPVGFKGKVYMLVDKYVYSAAEEFASFAKNSGFATLIGEKTGGDGITDDPLLCSLPNSGYVLRFSYVMGLTSDGSCNEEVKTEPDIKVDDAERNSDLNNDKAIQAALNLSKNNK